ncbi:MAG: TIGR04283 family arsenosugar biosynthesis glycosyltransferase [Planctomycetota bacterium]
MSESLNPVLSECLLIVFARKPEIGKCKTRLIPALGAEGAAQVHEAMTRHTLEWAEVFSEQAGCTYEVHFSGGVGTEFRECLELPAHISCLPQCEGDLGQRLRRVAENAAQRGVQSLLFVGTDCPSLNAQIARQVRERLQTHQVCIVPATDGGYTVLGIDLHRSESKGGLASIFDSLFSNIEWGTDSVFESSVAQLMQNGINSLATLPALHDVDTPEDLPQWEEAQTAAEEETPELSVVVPCKDEEPELAACLASAEGSERIVVGSGDMLATVLACREAGAHFVSHDGTRAAKLNLGQELARSDRLLFLHADSKLPADYLAQVEEVLSRESAAAGAFRLQIDSPRWAARWVEFGVWMRTRFRQMPYGDQAMFLRCPIFQLAGGFPEQDIMEDFEFALRLRRLGRIHLCRSSVKTSARRWHLLGFLRTTLINQWMIFAYRTGADPKELAKYYRGQSKKSEGK